VSAGHAFRQRVEIVGFTQSVVFDHASKGRNQHDMYLEIALALLTSLLMTISCSSDEITIEKESTSAAGSYTATFYVISGGGAAGWVVMRVNLRSKGETFRPNKGDIFEMRHAYELDLKWQDDRHLTVEYPNVAQIYRQNHEVGPISISYIARPTVDHYYLRKQPDKS